MSTLNIERTEIRTTYNGEQGCACGCRGTYATEGAAVTRRLNTLLAHADEVLTENFGMETCYEYEAPNGRVTRVYVINPQTDEARCAALAEMGLREDALALGVSVEALRQARSQFAGK